MTQYSPISRRELMKLSASGAVGGSLSGWLPAIASEIAPSQSRHRSMILLWMTGGPSQIDTFDMKPGHENGGPFRPIATSAPGIQICEHLPQLARVMHHCVPVRSMSTPETDHVLATDHLRTGRRTQESHIAHSNGSQITEVSGTHNSILPTQVAVAPYSRFRRSQVAPVVVGDANRPGLNPDNGLTMIESERSSVRSEMLKAFDLTSEPSRLRDAYGRNQFGQACLAARRLVERGVAVVDVSLNDVGNRQAFAWDTHSDNFRSVENLLHVLDPAWSTLITDLEARGLLDSTLIVWMGEFGRSPSINAQAGRDHFSKAWTIVLCGGGIQGGQTVGQTSSDGMNVIDRPVSAEDLCETIGGTLNHKPRAAAVSSLAEPTVRPLTEIL